MRYAIAAFSLFLLVAAAPGLAQSQDPSASAPANATKPTAAPASGATGTPTETKKPKKVWTNDEIASVHGTISVVGDAKPAATGEEKKKSEPTANAATFDDARKKQIENYRNQIEQIHGQMDAIDDQIAQLKSFKAEDTKPGSGINPNQGYNMVPLEDQVKQFEEKKKKLEAKISDIEIDAEKNGIDPGDLR